MAAIIGDPKSYVTFYSTEDAQKGPLRETLVSAYPPNDGRLLNQCRRKAKQIGARSFVIFVPIPRVWPVDFDDEDLN